MILKKIFFLSKYHLYKILNYKRVVKIYYDVYLEPNWNDNTFKYSFCGFYGDFLSNILLGLDDTFDFIDIGANQGLYSLVASKNEKIQKVFCVEPSLKTIKILKSNLLKNQVLDFEIIPFAISDKEGRASLKNFENHSGKSTLLESNQEFDNTEKIDSITHLNLEKLIISSNNLFIKIDVEGLEEIVINEVSKCSFFKNVKHIFYEVNEGWINHELIVKKLKNHGFLNFQKIGNKNHYDVIASR